MMLWRVESQLHLLMWILGNNMAKLKDEDLDIDIPGDGDENVGGEAPKKKVKKKKSKEERIAERKVVFWTLLIVLAITVGFWMLPKVSSLLNGNIPTKEINIDEMNAGGSREIDSPKSDNKNYREIVL